MALIDPNKTGGDFRQCNVGKKVLAVIGIDKRNNQKGNPQYEVHYVCVKDLAAEDGVGDKGAEHWDRFILIDSVRFRLGQAMKAAGHTTPFDDEDAALISEVLSNCYLVVTVSKHVYEGEDRFDTARNGWAPYTGAEESDWNDIIAKGVENHEKLREARKKKAQGGGSSGGAARRQADPTPGEDAGGGGSEDDGLPMY